MTVTGPGVVDLSYWRQDRSLSVHLVNLTNPMMMKGLIREVIPMGPYEVSVALPAGVAVRGVKLLESGKSVTTKRTGNRLTLTVPSVALHEIVAIDLV